MALELAWYLGTQDGVGAKPTFPQTDIHGKLWYPRPPEHLQVLSLD